jgi:hypothetical protein
MLALPPLAPATAHFSGVVGIVAGESKAAGRKSTGARTQPAATRKPLAEDLRERAAAFLGNRTVLLGNWINCGIRTQTYVEFRFCFCQQLAAEEAKDTNLGRE